MAMVPCANCGLERNIVNNFQDASQHENDVIAGALTCGGCGYQTVFRIKSNVSTFLPGKLFSQDLHKDIDGNAEVMVNEALKCFYGASYVVSVAMCRSAVAEQILGKKVGKRKDFMPELLKKAKAAGLVDNTDEVRAQTAGLVAREALHYMGEVTEDDAMIAIRSAVRLINNVASREPHPAS